MFKTKTNRLAPNSDSDKEDTKHGSVQVSRSAGCRVELKKQNPAVADILHESFELAQRDLVFVSAWPEGISLLRILYGKKLLIEACQMEKLVKCYGAGQMDLIEGSIKEEEGFMKPLSRSVCCSL